MGGKGGSVSSPDYTPVATSSIEAAKIQAQTSADQLQWSKEQFAQTNPETQKYLQSMIANSDAQTEQATDANARYKSIYQPVEDKFVQQTQNWNSPARSDQAAGAAMADVTATFDAARTSALSNLESYGIDPSQTRFGALDLGTRVSQAAATAAAGTQSRLNTEATGLAMESEAINIGRGYPGQVAQSYAGATAAGQAGINSALNTSSTYGNMMGSPTQWAGLSNQSYGTATGALKAGSDAALGNAQLDAQASAGTSAGIGSMVGGVLAVGAIAI